MVCDLRHFLDMPDTAPAPARRLATQLAAIVRAATARRAGSGWCTAVGCTKRPGRRPCEGFILVFRHANGEIAWSCNACGDEGRLHGWEDSPTDLSSFDDSHAEGDPMALLISRDLSDLLRDVLVTDDACELLVAGAEGRSDGVLLVGRTAAFEELLDYVAAEANAETKRTRQRRLDAACVVLEEALAGE
jgi:hypothetical protein